MIQFTRGQIIVKLFVQAYLLYSSIILYRKGSYIKNYGDASYFYKSLPVITKSVLIKKTDHISIIYVNWWNQECSYCIYSTACR